MTNLANIIENSIRADLNMPELQKGIDWSQKCLYAGIRRPELHPETHCDMCGYTKTQPHSSTQDHVMADILEDQLAEQEEHDN